MCRFLMVKSPSLFDPQPLLEEFALMCQKSRTLDGDWQGDGWGISWLNGHSRWQLKKSLLPIWKEQKFFKKIPQTRLFVAHARSASFASQKGIIDYNQPYIHKKHCFVFNGFLKGVKFPEKVKGKIGAQKIWNLLYQGLKKESPFSALKNLYQTLKNNSQKISGLNIGLANPDKFFILCGNHSHDYFSLRIAKTKFLKIVCSENLSLYKFKKMKKEAIIEV